MAARQRILLTTLRGLPELDRFRSAEARDAALARVDEGIRGRDAALGIAITALFAILTLVAMRLMLAMVPLGALNRFRGDLSLLVAIAAFVVAMRWLHRRGATATLRHALIDSGVPTCLGCGHSLEGLGPGTHRCPECGRTLGRRERSAPPGSEAPAP